MLIVNTPAEAGNGLVQALPSDADWKRGDLQGCRDEVLPAFPSHLAFEP